MKNLYLFLSLVFILSSDIKASGIQFVTSFEKAKELAKSQEKVIFVDVMADWCMPCKAMIQDINKNKEVYDFFNTHFINVQINEKYQRSFLTKYNVTAFPTLFFLSSSGDVLQSLVGYGGISLLYEQAQIHYNNNKIYKSIDIVDTDEFDEESFYNTLLGQYLSMPQSIKFKKSADYLDKGGFHAKAVINKFGQFTHFDDFKNYLIKNPTTEKNIAEQLLQSYLSSGKKVENNPNLKNDLKVIQKITNLDGSKSLAYLLFYNEAFVLNSIGLASNQKKILYGKGILSNYPDIYDLDILYEAISLTIKNEKNANFYISLIPRFEELAEIDGHYIYHDFLSILYFYKGDKENSSLAINKAMVKSGNNVQKFVPLFKKFRSDLINP